MRVCYCHHFTLCVWVICLHVCLCTIPELGILRALGARTTYWQLGVGMRYGAKNLGPLEERSLLLAPESRLQPMCACFIVHALLSSWSFSSDTLQRLLEGGWETQNAHEALRVKDIVISSPRKLDFQAHWDKIVWIITWSKECFLWILPMVPGLVVCRGSCEPGRHCWLLCPGPLDLPTSKRRENSVVHKEGSTLSLGVTAAGCLWSAAGSLCFFLARINNSLLTFNLQWAPLFRAVRE